MKNSTPIQMYCRGFGIEAGSCPHQHCLAADSQIYQQFADSQFAQHLLQEKTMHGGSTEEHRTYLPRVQRHLIDFDLEMACSVTLQTSNVYCCLYCGRYLQGKGLSTPAYQHSIDLNHHLFINLQSNAVFALPENQPVHLPQLADIQFNLMPKYTPEDISRLSVLSPQYSVDGKEYIPGVIGINNLKGTDYINSVLQILNAVRPFREFFTLREQEFHHPLLQKISLFIKKLWNWRSFKGSISPHELLQAISDASNKRYGIATRADPAVFLVWLIDCIARLLRKEKVSGIGELFRGELKTSLIKGIKNSADYESLPSKVEAKNFTVLRLQFEERGVFNRVQNQVEIKQLLECYLGQKGRVKGDGMIYMKITQYPQFLVLVYNRFKTNDYVTEKDATQVLYGEKLKVGPLSYRLVGQVCHQGTAKAGTYKAAVGMAERWFEVEDLSVKEVIRNQMLLGEPYIQVYQRLDQQ